MCWFVLFFVADCVSLYDCVLYAVCYDVWYVMVWCGMWWCGVCGVLKLSAASSSAPQILVLEKERRERAEHITELSKTADTHSSQIKQLQVRLRATESELNEAKALIERLQTTTQHLERQKTVRVKTTQHNTLCNH